MLGGGGGINASDAIGCSLSQFVPPLWLGIHLKIDALVSIELVNAPQKCHDCVGYSCNVYNDLSNS